MGTIDKSPVIADQTQKLHYEFCDDLSIKTYYQQAFEYQPRFALFKVRQEGLTYAQNKKEEGDNPSTGGIPTDLIYDIFDVEQAQQAIAEAKTKEGNLDQYKTDVEGEEEYEEKEGKGFQAAPDILLSARTASIVGVQSSDSSPHHLQVPYSLHLRCRYL